MALPTLVELSQGQIAYGGYTFPVGFMLTETDFNLQLDPVDIPFAAGAYTPTGKEDPKTYVISGTLGGAGAILDSTQLPMLTPDAVQAELDRMLAVMVGGEQAFQWRPDRYSLAQMYQPKVMFNTGEQYRFADVSISFTANDPRSYSYVQHSVELESTPNGGATSTNVSNVGNSRSYPVVTFTFPTTCVNPQFSIGTNQQDQYVVCALTGTFSTTDTVVITTEPRTRSIFYNGVKNWSVFNVAGAVNTITGDSSILPFIMPFSGTVTFTVAADSGQVRATAVYQDTWV